MATVLDGVYVLGEPVGKGGMAVVYRAEVDLLRFDYTTLYAYTQVQGDTHLERRRKAEEFAGKLRDQKLDLVTVRKILETHGIPVPGEVVALKVLTGEKQIERFEAEWKNLICLRHPNVIEVYGGGMAVGRPYYTMQLLERIVSPKRIMAEFTIQQKLEIIVQAGKGLAYLHENGLIHRDVKPDNMVTCEVEPGVFLTRVTDLGIAKNVGDDLGMTMTNQVMGTPYYMSPEQLASSKNVDERADVYSLGASLYELVTGVRPFHNKTSIYEILAAVTGGETPIPPKEHLPDLPDVLAAIIDYAMRRELGDRYPRVKDVVHDLELYLAEESKALTSSIAYKPEQKGKSLALAGRGRYVFEKIRHGIEREGVAERARSIMLSKKDGADKDVKPKAAGMPAWLRVAMALLLVLVIALVAALAFVLKNKNLERETPVEHLPSPPPSQPMQFTIKTPDALHAALKATNPNYDGKGKFETDGGKIVKVVLTGTGVSDLAALKGLPLERLACGKSEVADLAPLVGMKLKGLNCDDSKVSDLSPLRTMPLESLSCCRTAVADLASLHGMPLKRLGLSQTQVANLAALKGMPLEVLTIDQTQVQNLEPLEGLPLKTLAFSPGNITRGLAVVRGLTSIEKLGADPEHLLPAAEFWTKVDEGTPLETTAQPPLKYGEKNADGWICLFDGKTLDGWEHVTHSGRVKGFEIRDGTIFKPAGISGAARIDSTQQWNAFELRGKAWFGGSGATAYVCVYGTGTDTWPVLDLGPSELKDRWVDFSVKVADGKAFASLDGKAQKSSDVGAVGLTLEFNAVPPRELRIKDLWLRPLRGAGGPALKQGERDADGWMSIFNGKDLTGWWTDKPEKGYAAEGALVSTENADLFYRANWREFETEFEVMYETSGGGLNTCCMYLASSGTAGRASAHRANLVFCIDGDLHVNSWNTLLWNGPEDFPCGRWYRFSARLTDSSLKLSCAGKPLADIDLKDVPPRSGGIYFCGNDHTARLRNIRVRVLESGITTPVAGQSWTVPDLGMEFVPIQPGSFQREGGGKVTLTKPFWMGKFEVTQAQYQAVVGTNPSESKGDRLPVETVSWDEAVAFCAKLTERERAAGRLPDGMAYRLPTEAEWEYCCRAGTTTAFSFGDAAALLHKYGNYRDKSSDLADGKDESNKKDRDHDDGYSHTSPVGSFAANPWGLYDMHGNVWEWCQDWHGHYPADAVTDPTGPVSGSLRVFRGGSWGDGAVGGRSAARNRLGPGARHSCVGFRVVSCGR